MSERLHWESEMRARMRGSRKARKPLKASRLLELGELFGLDTFELDVLAALWTAAYDAEWRRDLAQGDAGGALTVARIAAALGHGARVRLGAESPLRLWRIVAEHPLLDAGAVLSLDPHVMAWLEGEHDIDRALVGHIGLFAPRFELGSWEIAERAGRIARLVAGGDRVRFRVKGSDASAGWSFAAALVRAMGFLALRVQSVALGTDDVRERAVRVQRLAFLDRCVPCWPASDATGAWPAEVVPFPLQVVVGDGPLPDDDRFGDVEVVLREPGPAERRQLWLTAPRAGEWPADALDDLALRFDAAPGEILRAAAADPEDANAAAACLRKVAVDDLDGLAQRLDCPFGWEDLVLPATVRERLEDVAFEARERARLWSHPDAARLYPQGRGLVALFAGPPGTGKTMSAQVIAADLGLDLLRVDISRILSKWVGETAQHLQKVLSSASSRRAVLLFDEADALFGKRIEDARQAQDHFINMDIGHLMVALESYDGVVLLATNLRANIDAAFVRRIRHAIDYPMPDATARAAIWSRTVQGLFGDVQATALKEAIARVARIEASGAQIKNAALSAAFTARRRRCDADAALLGAMLARELAKDGAGMSARELATTLEAVA
jgi:hypothetical protein